MRRFGYEEAKGLLGVAPRPGDVYRHYKGGLYTVVGCSLMWDTFTPLVTYRSREHGLPDWTRTLEEFQGLDEVDGVWTRRFVLEGRDPLWGREAAGRPET